MNRIPEGDDLEAEIQYLWHKYAQVPRERYPTLEIHPGAGQELGELLRDVDAESVGSLKTHFPRELRVLDECISWLAHLHLALHECLADDSPISEDRDVERIRAGWALVGFATAYAVSIRRLACAGLDFPARAVRRAMREALCLCTVLIRRDDLAHRYIEGSEGDRLWYEELRPARLNEHLLEIEGEIPDVGAEIAGAMGRSRRSADDLDSEAVHPSYSAAFFTGFARTPTAPDTYTLATLGRVSLAQGELLHRAVFDIWHFAVLGGYWLLVGADSPIRLIMSLEVDKRGSWNQMAIGRWVLIDAYLLLAEKGQGRDNRHFDRGTKREAYRPRSSA